MTVAEVTLTAEQLTVLAKLLPRLPPEWAGDTLAMLELAEKLKTPGCLTQTWHHDSRGQVNSVKHTPEWHRQGRRKSA